MADIFTFVTTVYGLFSRDPVKDPLIVTYNVDEDGSIRTDLTRESGATGDRWQQIFQRIFTGTVDPAFTAYIQDGTVPTGNADLVKLFNQVRSDLDRARDLLFPTDGGGERLPDDDFRPVFGGEQKTPIGVEDYFMPRFVRGFHRSIPGGVAGFAQQTPTGQRQLTGGGLSAPRMRGKVARRRPWPRRPVKRASSRKPRPGTKAWMSYIRGMRGKKRGKR